MGAPHSSSSTSLQSGVLGGGGKEGMHQRSFSVSSADQWNEAVINPGAGPAAHTVKCVNVSINHDTGKITLNRYRGIRDGVPPVPPPSAPVLFKPKC
ncbi:unnamed protein product [Arctogadus glacialis]